MEMPIPVKYIDGKKTFTILENNPEVLSSLAYKLGLSEKLQFYDVYSLTEPDLLALIPRPVHALLVIFPPTPTWKALCQEEDSQKGRYEGRGPSEEVIWFKQTIGEACGSIGLIHCTLNGSAKDFLLPGSTLWKIRQEAVPLGMEDRAQLLYESTELENDHQAAAELGDSEVPEIEKAPKSAGHFVAFVKENGKLWELEGGRKGPLERATLNEDEDVLSPRALEAGIGRVIRNGKENGDADLNFSCIALASAT